MVNMLHPSRLRTWIAIVLAFVASMAVPGLRAETFDVSTFDAPPGKRSETTGWLSFSDSTRTTFAGIGLYRSLAGTGDPARDFNDEWAVFVSRLDLPIDPTTVTTGGDYFATRAQ
jgi:hypothetical protein